jgi:acetylornithine aminotransferase
MKIFDVYPLYDIHPVKGNGIYIFDAQGNKYMDFYGGHAVISIGHNENHYVHKLKHQLNKLSYYSNSVHIDLQEFYAKKLGSVSGYDDYQLFMCNSGAEANENALKIASFYTKKKKVIAFRRAFHGRTSAAVAVTDNKAIKAPINDDDFVIFLPFNDTDALQTAFQNHKDIAAVIIEPIQGVAGIYEAEANFLKLIEELCFENNAIFIADEIQCGCGRTGKYFAHQWSEAKPDIITMAKGIGNGFPIGAVAIHPKFQAKHGMLGTTFGGSPLACAAGIAVLDVIEEKQLINHADKMSKLLLSGLAHIPQIKRIRGRGLMLGIEFHFPIANLRNHLLFEHKIFTGNASEPHTLRLLPPLNIKKKHIDKFLSALSISLETIS